MNKKQLWNVLLDLVYIPPRNNTWVEIEDRESWDRFVKSFCPKDYEYFSAEYPSGAPFYAKFNLNRNDCFIQMDIWKNMEYFIHKKYVEDGFMVGCNIKLNKWYLIISHGVKPPEELARYMREREV